MILKVFLNKWVDNLKDDFIPSDDSKDDSKDDNNEAPNSSPELEEKKKVFYQAISLLISITSQPQAFGFYDVDSDKGTIQNTNREYKTVLKKAFKEDIAIKNYKNLGQLAQYWPQLMKTFIEKLYEK